MGMTQQQAAPQASMKGGPTTHPLLGLFSSILSPTRPLSMPGGSPVPNAHLQGLHGLGTGFNGPSSMLSPNASQNDTMAGVR